VAFKRGIGFTLAGRWSGPRELKAQLKERGIGNCCSVCPPRPSASLPRQT
jgi:hypothetical protein